MLSALLVSALVAFPKPGMKLPYVERAYMIGAVEPGVTNLVVQGRPVEVYRTGAWATMVDVTPGTNEIELAVGDFKTNHVFTVGAKPQPRDPSLPPPPEKKWEKLAYAGDVPKAHPSGKAPGEITVTVDPGHGGSETGAYAPHGYMEKNANLLVSLELRKALEKRGYKVVMTRETDKTVPLYDRPKVAHAAGADAFISVHHNAPPANADPRTVRYTCAYSWNPLGEKLAAALNARVASAFEGEIPSHGTLHANFAVTRNPEIPSALVEIDFLTSPEGEEAVFDLARIAHVAEALADGFADWCATGSEP